MVESGGDIVLGFGSLYLWVPERRRFGCQSFVLGFMIWVELGLTIWARSKLWIF